MKMNAQRRTQDQLVLGVLLVIIAISIILVAVLKLSILYLPALIALLIGVYYLYLSLGKLETEHREYTFGPGQERYRFAWGVALAALGALGLFYLSVPGIGLVVVLALLILVAGIVVILYRMWGRA
jgi:hypothetical protein